MEFFLIEGTIAGLRPVTRVIYRLTAVVKKTAVMHMYFIRHEHFVKIGTTDGML
jgi:hypothetical protein